jgi:hypothetical protein
VTGEVDEQPLGRDVHRAQSSVVQTIQIPEPGVAEPAACRRAVFLPRQRERYFWPTLVAMHRRPNPDRALVCTSGDGWSTSSRPALSSSGKGHVRPAQRVRLT